MTTRAVRPAESLPHALKYRDRRVCRQCELHRAVRIDGHASPRACRAALAAGEDIAVRTRWHTRRDRRRDRL